MKLLAKVCVSSNMAYSCVRIEVSVMCIICGPVYMKMFNLEVA